MEKIKVYLQYPWKISDSQYYKSILDSPPEGIEYIVEGKKHGMITSKSKMLFFNFLKKLIRRNLRRMGISLLNIHKKPKNKNYNLLHCAHCLSSGNAPWVADFESVWQMLITDHETLKGLKKASKILEKDNCKKIIAWTEETKKDIIKKFPRVQDKVEVVTYGIAPSNFKKTKSKNIRLLFIGRYFMGKGGLHTVEAFDRLTKTFKNVEALVVGEIPEFIRKKYSKNKKLKWFNLIDHKKLLEEIYPSTDIYVCPGYSDTFGFPFVEALAFGLPVVTVNVPTRKEIIEDGKNGFVVSTNGKINQTFIGEKEEKVIKKIVERTSELIKDENLRIKMSKEGLKIVKSGKFSIKERNKKLKKVYEEALK